VFLVSNGILEDNNYTWFVAVSNGILIIQRFSLQAVIDIILEITYYCRFILSVQKNMPFLSFSPLFCLCFSVPVGFNSSLPKLAWD
jgi:hypothetical protein